MYRRSGVVSASGKLIELKDGKCNDQVQKSRWDSCKKELLECNCSGSYSVEMPTLCCWKVLANGSDLRFSR